MTTTRRLVPSIVAGLSLLVGSPAWAGMSCDDIMNLVSVNVPTNVVVDTIASSGSTFDTADIKCLVDKGAPPEILAQASKMLKASEPAPSEDPLSEEEEAEDAFESTEALPSGGDLFTEEPAESGSADPADLEAFIRDYKAGKYRTASYGLYQLLEENAYPEKDTTIKYYLAKSLDELEMYHAAQHYYMEVIRKGPQNPLFKYALPKLTQIANYTGNDIELLRVVDKIDPGTYPKNARPELFYLMGRKAYEAGELSEAAAAFERVPSNHELYPRAQYFQGVINFDREKLKSAAKAFREVVRAEIPTDDPRTISQLEDLKDLSLINIARVYYGLQRFDSADAWYAKVDRNSTYWPQSLFERAWTRFFLGDLNASLGHILTAESPFFDRTFIPDTQYLRALIYFQLCEFDEVFRVVKLFQAEYGPAREEMKAFIETYRTEEGRKLFDKAFDTYFGAGAGDSDLPVALFSRILRNRDMSALIFHLDMMEGELEAIDAQTPQWRDTVGAHLAKVIARDRQRYKERAGRELLQEMLESFRTVDELLQDADILLFELADAQRADYMFKSANPDVDAVDEQPIDFATSPDIIYWPWNGEFWRDELGYYRFTEKGSCN